MTVQTYIGMGSNLGDSRQILSSAIDAMQKLAVDGAVHLSSLYRTQPVGPQDQADYLNAVAGLQTELGPIELLDALQAIEQQHRRVRGEQPWGPRTLDLDILLYGSELIHQERLVVPHQHMHERCFVLQPLLELAGNITVPGKGDIRSLLRQCDVLRVEKLDAFT